MIRPAQPGDAAMYAEWLKEAADLNLVDQDVYTYPTCQTVVVENKDGQPQLMNSFHAVLVMEALAPRPGITPMQEGRALLELIEKVKDAARACGIKEVIFGCKDERLATCVDGKRGFEKLSFPVFRCKL